MWTRLFILVNYVSWTILFVALLVFHKAQPEFDTLFDRFYQLNLRTHWDKDFVRYFVYTAGLGLGASAFGLGLAIFRARRRTDHKIPIRVLGGLYLILLVLAWILL
ncbi:MAG: hypothetical protein HUK40_21660 [Desulfobacter sp.]|nr:hypothetical protein [Desulfobacter sp.]WDP86010.1 MAG: hypothetical protein HUN05_13440 [Desulfobacter sp.]